MRESSLVLWSSHKSIKNRNISLLAIVEIVVAVAFYWWLTYYYDTYWHILASIFVTPFLLLRSEQSISLTLDLMDKGIRKRKPISEKIETSMVLTSTNILIGLWIYVSSMIALYLTDNIVLNLFLALFVSFFFIGLILSSSTLLSVRAAMRRSKNNITFYLFIIVISLAMASLYPFIGLVNSILVTIIVTFVEALLIYLVLQFKENSFLYSLTRPPLLFFLGVGGIFGSLIILMLYRVVSTIIFIKYGYKNFLSNWHESMLIKDIKSQPEIVPGIESYESYMSDMFKLSNFSLKIKKNIQFNYLDPLYHLLKYSILFTIITFYRLSIKATFWFFIPLLFLVKSPNLSDSKKISSFLSSLFETKIAWLRAFLALIVIVYFILTHFNFITFEHWDSPFAHIILILYLDYSNVELWQYFQLSVAVLSIVLFLYADRIKVTKIDNDIVLTKNDFSISIILILNKIRNLMSFFYHVTAFIILCVYLRVWEYKYIPSIFNGFLTTMKSYIIL